MALPPLIAILVLFTGAATMIAVGVLAQMSGLAMLPSLILGEIAMLSIPLLAIRRLDLRRAALGLRLPRPELFAAAVLIGTTTWYLNLQLVDLLPFREGSSARALEQMVEQPPLVLSLFAVALVPAICEEVMFRGCLQRALATRLYPAAAIVLTSLLFAGYHLSLVQLIPTFNLALLIGALAWRGDSTLPGMVAHFLNNSMAILVARIPSLESWFGHHPDAALAGCAIGTLAGIAVIARAPAA